MPSTPLSVTSTAFLLLDYQNAVLPTLPDAAGLVLRAADALETVRRAGVRVVYVRVALTPEQRAAVPDRNRMFARIAATGFLAAGSTGCEIADALAPRDKDIVVTKTRVNAFGGTGLEERLHEAGIDSLILAGVYTSGVVLSTLRHAADLDYRLLVVRDLCSDPKPEVHSCLFDQVFPAQADVIETGDLPRLLG